MGVGIDTNVLVQYFTKDNENLSRKAEEFIVSTKPNEVVLDRLIIATWICPEVCLWVEKNPNGYCM